MSAHCCGQHWGKPVTIEKAAKPAQWRALHAVADKMKPALKRTFLNALRGIKDETKLRDLTIAVETGRVDIVMRSLGLDTLNAKLNDLRRALRATYERGAQASQAFVPASVAQYAQFNLMNPASVNFIQNYEFSLMRDITATTVAGLRGIIGTAFEYGITPNEQARMIRNVIGLTDRQADAVSQYERMLRDTKDYTPARIEELVGRFAERQLRWRAEIVARTESIRAAGAGREALWHQMVANGTMDPKGVRRQWINTPDDRLCPVCEDIPLNNSDGVGLDEPFATDLGPVMQEPAHPQCRCSVNIVYLTDEELRDAA